MISKIIMLSAHLFSRIVEFPFQQNGPFVRKPPWKALIDCYQVDDSASEMNVNDAKSF